MSDKERADLNFFTSNELKEINEVTKVFPNVDISFNIYCEGEEEICVGDFITFEIIIDRVNMKEGE